MPAREEIVEFVDEVTAGDEEIILFDGQEAAFVGIAERFEPSGHRYFAVYDYRAMRALLMADGATEEEADDYLGFNVIGLYAGEGTPAILYPMEGA